MTDYALVVDADASRSAAYTEILMAEGITALCVDNGAEAVEVLVSIRGLKMVVTDLSLPRVDGFEVLRRLQQSCNASVPVLVRSAFREMRAIAAVRRSDLGINAILPASASTEIVTQAVRHLLSGRARGLPAWETSIEAMPFADEQRLASLLSAGALRTDIDDSELQSIVRNVATRFDVPVVLVSIVLQDKQWFKTRIGMKDEETALDVSFCRHVVAAREAMVVPDANKHPVFANNGLVRTNVVRGYAGAPLVSTDGEVWGSLCIIDPRHALTVSADDMRQLERMAREVVVEIERRGKSVTAERSANRDLRVSLAPPKRQVVAA